MPGIVGNVMQTRGKRFGSDPAIMPFTPGLVLIGRDGKVRIKNGHHDYCCCGCQYGDVSSASDPYCSDVIPAYYTVTFSGVTSCPTCFDDTTAFGVTYFGVWGHYPKDGIGSLVINGTTGVKFVSGGWTNDVGDGTGATCIDPGYATGAPYIHQDSCATPGAGSLEYILELFNDATNWYLTAHESAFNTCVFVGSVARTDTTCYRGASWPITIPNLNTTCGAESPSLAGSPTGFIQFATGGTATITPCCDAMALFPDATSPYWTTTGI